MVRWVVDHILAAFNYVPELILAKDDPRFDFLRWWFVLVLLAVCVFIFGMVRRAKKPPANSN